MIQGILSSFCQRWWLNMPVFDLVFSRPQMYHLFHFLESSRRYVEERVRQVTKISSDGASNKWSWPMTFPGTAFHVIGYWVGVILIDLDLMCWGWFGGKSLRFQMSLCSDLEVSPRFQVSWWWPCHPFWEKPFYWEIGSFKLANTS